MSFIILIAGIPATGKSTFAEYLSKNTGIPMVSKDAIKESLYDSIGFKSRTEKVALGIAAMNAMYYFAEAQISAGGSIILENNFENDSKPGLEYLIQKYTCKTITISFRGDINIIYKRFIKRNQSPDRHRGHILNTQYPEQTGASFSFPPTSFTDFKNGVQQRGMLDFSVGGEEILVDATDFTKISYEQILCKVKEKLPPR